MTGSAPRSCVAALAVALLIVAGSVPSLPAVASCDACKDSGSGAPSQGRAVERPDHDGPHVNGTVAERFRGSTKLYSIDIKIYYPATSAGTDTPPDASGAPYPVILMMPYAGSDETAYDFVAPRLVSWGFVVVCVGQNQADSSSGDPTDVNDLLDQLEEDNATTGHRLEGMVNAGAFGITGHSRGGAYSVLDGCYVPRLRAVQAMAPALSQVDVDAMAGSFSKPFQVQVGRLDASFWNISLHTYRSFPAPKGALDLANTGHGGPFYWDLAISFFFRYLLGLTDYERFLYGEQAIDDAADGKYFLNFTLENGEFFPPSLAVSTPEPTVYEDGPVSFYIRYDGALPLGHPRSNFTWDFTSDGTVELRGPSYAEAMASFERAGITTVTAQFVLGELVLGTNNTLTLNVLNIPPTVTVGGDLRATEDEAVNLSARVDDTSSDRYSLSCTWDFGDGTVAMAPDVTHAWKRAGNYTARITARDDEGAEGTASLNVTVANLVPSATAGPDVESDMDSEVSFDGSGDDTPSDRAGLRYRWDFGDGSSSDWSIEPGAAHTYTSAGRFVAVLSVQDGDGSVAQATVNVTVQNVPPYCKVTAPRPGATVQKDEPAELDGAGTDTASDRPSLQYSWDLGDGNSTGWATSARVTHVYRRGGHYDAWLSVRDRAGAVERSTISFTVVNQPPAVRITAPLAGDFEEDAPVWFTAEGKDTSSDAVSLRYSWLIDGRALAGRSVEAVFTTEGPHAFCVTVSDTEGATGTADGTVFICNPPPRLWASVEPLTLLVNEPVRFSAIAEDTASDLGALTFSWDFGDGASSSAPFGTHLYKQAGTFTVRVSVRDDEGARDTRIFTVRVDEPPGTPPPGGTGASAGAPLLAAPAAAAIVGATALIMVAAVLILWRRRRA